MRWLFLLFIVVPLVELYLLLVIGDHVGFVPTVSAVVVEGIFGAWLARREGRRVWRAWREALQRMQPPEEGVVDGVLVLVGAVLLLTPGVLTDVVGMFLLVPFTRRLVARRVRRSIDERIADGRLRAFTYGFPGVPVPGDGVVETSGQSVEETATPAPAPRPKRA